MDEILLRAVKRVLASDKDNKLVLLEEMLGSDWATVLDESFEDWRSKV